MIILMLLLKTRVYMVLMNYVLRSSFNALHDLQL